MKTKLTLELDAPPSVLHALAGVLDMAAGERRTAGGAISRSGKGSYTWTPDARDAFAAAAYQIREQL